MSTTNVDQTNSLALTAKKIFHDASANKDVRTSVQPFQQAQARHQLANLAKDTKGSPTNNTDSAIYWLSRALCQADYRAHKNNPKEIARLIIELLIQNEGVFYTNEVAATLKPIFDVKDELKQHIVNHFTDKAYDSTDTFVLTAPKVTLIGRLIDHQTGFFERRETVTRKKISALITKREEESKIPFQKQINDTKAEIDELERRMSRTSAHQIRQQPRVFRPDETFSRLTSKLQRLEAIQTVIIAASTTAAVVPHEANGEAIELTEEALHTFFARNNMRDITGQNDDQPHDPNGPPIPPIMGRELTNG